MPMPAAVTKSGVLVGEVGSRGLDARLLLTRVLEDASDAIIATGEDQEILLFNRAAEELFGYCSDELIGQPLSMLLPQRVRRRHAGHVARFSGETIERRSMSERSGVVGLRRDGDEFPAEVTIAKLRVSGHLVFTATVRDVSERVALEEQRRRAETRFESLVEHSADTIMVVSPDRRLLFTSPAYTRLLGHATVKLGEQATLPRVHPEDEALFEDTFTDVIAGGTRSREQEMRLLHRDGDWRWIHATCTNLLEEPSVGGVVINAHDITARKSAEAALRQQALFDPLTGLPNRILLADRLTQALASSERTGCHVAVLFLDIDRFKVVNDSLGHGTGDALLLAVARRLQKIRRGVDTIARLGGDEFLIVAPGLEGREQALQLADRILASLDDPFHLANRELFLTASIGVSVSQGDRPTAERVIADADAAMYEAKRRGGKRWTLFDNELRNRMLQRITVETELRLALGASDQIVVHYQPIVELTSGRVVSREALARWEHPERGLILPGEFILVAEETGLIQSLGAKVLDAACRDSGRRARIGIDEMVSVNLSPCQLEDPQLLGLVQSSMERYGIPRNRLAVEVTENVLIRDIDRAAFVLGELRRLGVRLVIDDFGVGYASLRYLHRLPLDILKIDREFISSLVEDAADATIVSTIISMAHNMGLSVVAEGVETQRQADVLQELGCDYGQGYLFGRPRPG
jgi:diguanylate cyclase (GGDEF)-like protein/PAS domain S-box-containing protein